MRSSITSAPCTLGLGPIRTHDGPGGGAVPPLPGVATTIATGVPQPATPQARQVRSYRVAKGDTLGRIAQRHGCEVKALARANGLKAPGYSVKQGQQLKLEGCTQ